MEHELQPTVTRIWVEDVNEGKEGEHALCLLLLFTPEVSADILVEWAQDLNREM